MDTRRDLYLRESVPRTSQDSTHDDKGQGAHVAGNQYKNIIVRDDARAQLGNILGPVTVTGKLVLINPHTSRILWTNENRQPPVRSLPQFHRSSSPRREIGNTLADHFLTSVERLHVIQRYNNAKGSRYLTLETKVNNLSARLEAWGTACSLDDPRHYDKRLDQHRNRTHLEKTLQCINEQLTPQRLREEYGLKQQEEGRSLAAVLFGFRRNPQLTEHLNADDHEAARPASSQSATPWSIVDEAKFGNLLVTLREFIEDLEALTLDLHISRLQRSFLDAKIESISDISTLDRIEKARIGPNDPVSDSASQRLLNLREASTRGASSATAASLSSVSEQDTFVTAPTLLPVADNASELRITPISSVSVPQNQRVIAYLRRPSQAKNVGESPRVPFDAQHSHVGKLLHEAKAEDVSHTKAVLSSHIRTTSAEARRMILLLQNMLDAYPTPFISLAPIGDDLFDLLGRIEGPPSSPYDGGIFYVRIQIRGDFPFEPPECQFLTKIYHPNIDAQGKICLDILDPEKWRLELMYLEGILLSICSLLDEPSVEDPLVPEIAAQFIQDRSRYNQIAREYTHRYARSEPPDLISLRSRSTSHQPASWQVNFLRGRLARVRDQSATLLQFWERERARSSCPQHIQQTSIAEYVNLLYQLSLQLSILEEPLGDSRNAHSFARANFESLENFFDLCAGELRALVTDVDWRSTFPKLPNFPNEATRGTGQSYTFRFDYKDRTPKAGNTQMPIHPLEQDAETSGSPVEPTATDSDLKKSVWIEGLQRLVSHCRWLNGDSSLVPRETVRRPV